MPADAGLALTDDETLDRGSAEAARAANVSSAANETELTVRSMTRVLSVLPSLSGRLADGC
jgi:hypothetical protein